MSITKRARQALGRIFYALGLNDPKAWDKSLWNPAGARSLSGEVVTPETALTYSAVWNAVNLIAGTISSLPLHIMQTRGDHKQTITNKPLSRVLHSRANRYMTAKAFREVLTSHILLWGNGYAEKVTNAMGDIVELWPIAPNRVTPVWENGEIFYRIDVPGDGQKYFGRDKILHIAGLGSDGLIGYSVIAIARKSIGLGMALETFGSLYFGQGTHPGVVVSHPSGMSPETYDNLRRSLTESYSGLGQSHRLMLLEDGMKIENIGIPPEDSQFLESRQFQIPEIARWFNLPPHKLKDLTKSSFSNIESEQRSFYTDSLLPWLVTLEQNFNMQLLTEREFATGHYCKHSVEGILRADAAGRAAFYRDLFNIGAISINEIRAYEDLDPIDGGDIHLVPLNMTTIDSIGKEPVVEPQEGKNDKENGDETVV